MVGLRFDFHSTLKLKGGDSRLSRRFPAWLRMGSCFFALCRDTKSRTYLRSTG